MSIKVYDGVCLSVCMGKLLQGVQVVYEKAWNFLLEQQFSSHFTVPLTALFSPNLQVLSSAFWSWFISCLSPYK